MINHNETWVKLMAALDKTRDKSLRDKWHREALSRRIEASRQRRLEAVLRCCRQATWEDWQKFTYIKVAMGAFPAVVYDSDFDPANYWVFEKSIIDHQWVPLANTTVSFIVPNERIIVDLPYALRHDKFNIYYAMRNDRNPFPCWRDTIGAPGKESDFIGEIK